MYLIDLKKNAINYKSKLKFLFETKQKDTLLARIEIVMFH